MITPTTCTAMIPPITPTPKRSRGRGEKARQRSTPTVATLQYAVSQSVKPS